MILKKVQFLATLICFSVATCSAYAKEPEAPQGGRTMLSRVSRMFSGVLDTLSKPQVAVPVVLGAGLVLMSMLPTADADGGTDYCESMARVFNTSLSWPVYLGNVTLQSGEETGLYGQFGEKAACYSAAKGFFQALRDFSGYEAMNFAREHGFVYLRTFPDVNYYTSIFYQFARDFFSETCFRGEEEASCRNVIETGCKMAGDWCRESIDTMTDRLCIAWRDQCLGATR